MTEKIFKRHKLKWKKKWRLVLCRLYAEQLLLVSNLHQKLSPSHWAHCFVQLTKEGFLDKSSSTLNYSPEQVISWNTLSSIAFRHYFSIYKYIFHIYIYMYTYIRVCVCVYTEWICRMLESSSFPVVIPVEFRGEKTVSCLVVSKCLEAERVCHERWTS